LEKNCSASHHRKKKREKTILRILCLRAFLHSLDPERKSLLKILPYKSFAIATAIVLAPKLYWMQSDPAT